MSNGSDNENDDKMDIDKTDLLIINVTYNDIPLKKQLKKLIDASYLKPK